MEPVSLEKSAEGRSSAREIGGEEFNLRLLDGIRVLQDRFIAGHDLREIFNRFVTEILRLTRSEYAFIGEVLHAPDGHPFLKIHDISHIARDEATRRFFEAHAPAGAEFHDLDNLFGWAILRKEPVIANEPRKDPRWGGRQPAGHPPLTTFLGLPFLLQEEVIGLVGLANRPGGYSEDLVAALQPVVTACTTILKSFRDSRSRKEAEESLAVTSSLFKALVENSSEAIAVIDGQGRFAYASPSTLNVLGFHPGELAGLEVIGRVHPEDAPRLSAALAGLVDGSLAEVKLEARFLHKDGRYRWLESSHSGRFQDPAIRGIVSNFRDITERRQAVVDLQESEARFRTLSESVPVILWVAGPDGEWQHINRFWFEYSGLSRGKDGAADWKESLFPADREPFLSAWQAALASRTAFTREFRIRRASDGAFRWHLARAVPVRDGNGVLTKWLGTSVDIHDQKEFAEVSRVKEQLDRQTRLLEAVLETMGDGLIVSDANRKYLVFNKEAKRILSLTPDEIESNRQRIEQQIRLFREDGTTPLPLEESPMNRALRGVEVTNESILIEGPQYPDGLWLNVSSRSLPWEGRQAAVAVFQDITLRKRAELLNLRHAFETRLRSELQGIFASEGRLTDLIERSLVLLVSSLRADFGHVWLLQADGGSVELAGYTGTFPMPEGKFRIRLGEGKVGQVALTRRPILTNALMDDPTSLFQEWTRRNGVRGFAGIPLISESELVGVLSVFSKRPIEASDMRLLESLAFLFAESIQRRQAQEALRESEERFRTLVEGVQDYAIFMLDQEGRVASWNDGAQRITGYRKDEIAQAQFGFLYPDDARERGEPAAHLEAALRAGRFETEGPRTAKGGRTFWATVHITAIRDAGGSLKGFAQVIRDITEKRRMDEALQERTRELEALNKELEAFSYSVSHDLRAPLRGLDGFSRALEERLGPGLEETSRSYLARIRGASHKMGTLIDSLLDLSRLNRVELVLEKVDVSAIAGQIIKEFSEAEPGRKVRVEIEKGIEVLGDRRFVERLLSNLLGNAWKFTGKVASPSIRLGQRVLEGIRVVYVEDNGAGFDMAFAHKLFGAFQRLHGQAEFPGTGIGLAIAHRIVTRHHGEIWAESAPDRGATFYFTLNSRRPVR